MCTWLCRGPCGHLRCGNALGGHSMTQRIVSFPGTTHHSKGVQGRSAGERPRGTSGGDGRELQGPSASGVPWDTPHPQERVWRCMGNGASQGRSLEAQRLGSLKKKSSGILGIGHVGTRGLAHTHIPGSQRGAGVWHSLCTHRPAQ